MAADDFDVEAMLEATYNKTQPLPVPGEQEKEEPEEESVVEKPNNNNDESAEKEATPPQDDDEEERRRRKKKKRSPSRSRSPRHRRRRSRSRDKHRSHRHHRSRSKSPDRRRRSRDRDYRDRDRDKDRRERDRDRDRKKSLPSPPPQPMGKRQRSPDVEPPSIERDNRTVMCMQLSARVTKKDLEDFFGRAGAVREVHLISDRQSRRSKGIAYVEFEEESSIPGALSFSGQKVLGIPIMIQPTMAEKNRLAAAAENLKKAEGPKKLYVGSLHYNITEDMLHGIFSPFGYVERVSIMRDSATNVSRGYAFVEFRDSDSAERAMANLNGFELAGRPMKVNYGTIDNSIVNIDSLDGEDMDVGVGMTPQSRVALMNKLAASHTADMSIPQFSVPSVAVTSSCFVLSNLFDPSKEAGSDWDREIRDDVLEECVKFGSILHVHVDKFSQGKVYVKCQTPQVANAVIASFNGRRYAGNYITTELVPENTYHLKFPGALAANIPLRPNY